MAVAAAVATAVAAAVAAAVAVAAAELLPLKQEITGPNLTGFKAFSTPHILRQSTIDIYVSPLPCDVTLQVSDISGKFAAWHSKTWCSLLLRTFTLRT